MPPRRKKRFPVLAAWAAALSVALSGCATRHSPYGKYYVNSGAYRAPGTPSDPWGPYITEAATRFAIPEEWIRAVIQQESGGHEYLDGQPITSSAGAMGLMQLMPSTYAEMQDRYDLGPDPYDPHDNIVAGTGYIRILSAKYGVPAFLAAYNAGPQRLEAYLYNGRSLPNETVNYVASITPHLGNRVALTGPLAIYGTNDQMIASAASQAETPDMDATSPAGSAESPGSVRDVWAARTGQLAAPTPVPCDPNTAYDPDVPCVMPTSTPRTLPAPAGPDTGTARDALPPAPPAVRQVAYRPPPPIIPTPRPSPAGPKPLPHDFGNWAVQVGAFTNPGQARFAATMARQAAFGMLQASQVRVQPTIAHGSRFWRARLGGISRAGAVRACASLAEQGMACMPVPPGRQG